jgi:hypothetical protein
VTRSIAETMEAFRADRLSYTIAFPTAEALRAEQEELERDRAAWMSEAVGPVTVEVTDEDWSALHMDEKRALIESFFEAIVIRPPSRRSNRFDPARVAPVPRSAA